MKACHLSSVWKILEKEFFYKMAQNFIPKTLAILYSITKGISKIYQLKREYWLSEVL